MADFTAARVDVGDVVLHVSYGGTGRPLLLLHGYPETHLMWDQVASRLADEFTVVMPDLRGYGRSAKPPAAPDHSTYGKRAMAGDAVALMRHLGFDHFDVAGHDRGARAGYRLALDHPAAVRRLSVLDIVPTGEVWARADARFARGYWHWPLLAQPFPIPERLIAPDPDWFFFDAQFGGIRRRRFGAARRPLLSRAAPGRHAGGVAAVPWVGPTATPPAVSPLRSAGSPARPPARPPRLRRPGRTLRACPALLWSNVAQRMGVRPRATRTRPTWGAAAAVGPE